MDFTDAMGGQFHVDSCSDQIRVIYITSVRVTVFESDRPETNLIGRFGQIHLISLNQVKNMSTCRLGTC